MSAWGSVPRPSCLSPEPQPPTFGGFAPSPHLLPEQGNSPLHPRTQPFPIADFCRQRVREGKGVVFTTTLIKWSGFNPHPGHVAATLDETLCDDYYLCFEQAANSGDNNSKKSTGTLDHRKLLSRCGFLQSRSSDCNEKCADRPITWRLTLSGGRRINMPTTTTTTTISGYAPVWL